MHCNFKLYSNKATCDHRVEGYRVKGYINFICIPLAVIKPKAIPVVSRSSLKFHRKESPV